jgi:hypothetical protein
MHAAGTATPCEVLGYVSVPGMKNIFEKEPIFELTS